METNNPFAGGLLWQNSTVLMSFPPTRLAMTAPIMARMRMKSVPSAETLHQVRSSPTKKKEGYRLFGSPLVCLAWFLPLLALGLHLVNHIRPADTDATLLLFCTAKHL